MTAARLFPSDALTPIYLALNVLMFMAGVAAHAAWVRVRHGGR